MLHSTRATASPKTEATTTANSVVGAIVETNTTTIDKTFLSEKSASESVEELVVIYDTAQAMVSTEGWKTCRNEWSGWEIQYPPDWQTYGHRAGIRPSDCTGGMVTFANWTPEEAQNENDLHANDHISFSLPARTTPPVALAQSIYKTT